MKHFKGVAMKFIRQGINYWIMQADRVSYFNGVSFARNLSACLMYLYWELLDKGQAELKESIEPTDYENEIIEEVKLSFKNSLIMQKRLKDEEEQGEVLWAIYQFIHKIRGKTIDLKDLREYIFDAVKFTQIKDVKKQEVKDAINKYGESYSTDHFWHLALEPRLAHVRVKITRNITELILRARETIEAKD